MVRIDLKELHATGESCKLHMHRTVHFEAALDLKLLKFAVTLFFRLQVLRLVNLIKFIKVHVFNMIFKLKL